MMGYLSATPEGSKQPRSAHWTMGLPEAGPLIYLWHWICEIGLGTSISWREIKAWSDLTGIEPTKDESTAIVQLSNMWLNERARGHDKHALPCWMGD